MRLTSKGQYALIGMLDVLKYSKGSPVSLQAIAERQNLSLNYLEQLFKKLREHGLVSSTRGPGGGYMLNEEPKYITVQDILSSVGEDVQTHQVILVKDGTKEQKAVLCLFDTIQDTVGLELRTTLHKLSRISTP